MLRLNRVLFQGLALGFGLGLLSLFTTPQKAWAGRQTSCKNLHVRHFTQLEGDSWTQFREWLDERTQAAGIGSLKFHTASVNNAVAGQNYGKSLSDMMQTTGYDGMKDSVLSTMANWRRQSLSLSLEWVLVLESILGSRFLSDRPTLPPEVWPEDPAIRAGGRKYLRPEFQRNYDPDLLNQLRIRIRIWITKRVADRGWESSFVSRLEDRGVKIPKAIYTKYIRSNPPIAFSFNFVRVAQELFLENPVIGDREPLDFFRGPQEINLSIEDMLAAWIEEPESDAEKVHQNENLQEEFPPWESGPSPAVTPPLLSRSAKSKPQHRRPRKKLPMRQRMARELFPAIQRLLPQGLNLNEDLVAFCNKQKEIKGNKGSAGLRSFLRDQLRKYELNRDGWIEYDPWVHYNTLVLVQRYLRSVDVLANSEDPTIIEFLNLPLGGFLNRSSLRAMANPKTKVKTQKGETQNPNSDDPSEWNFSYDEALPFLTSKSK